MEILGHLLRILKMKKQKIIFILYLIIIVVASSQVSATITYWIGDGTEDLSIDKDHVIFVDVSPERVGIGDPTPDNLFDVEGTGNLVYSYSTNGVGIYVQGSGHGIYSLSSGTTARAAYGYNSGSSGYAVYGLASSSSYSGWFTGGKGLFAGGGRVYNYASCTIRSTANSNTQSCSTGEEVVGGGCNCDCGSLRTIYSRPGGSLSAPTSWSCFCADCTCARTYAVCCGGT